MREVRESEAQEPGTDAMKNRQTFPAHFRCQTRRWLDRSLTRQPVGMGKVYPGRSKRVYWGIDREIARGRVWAWNLRHRAEATR